MPKSQMNIYRRASILEARAGLIPASDDVENELDARVAHIGRAVKAYGELNGGRDDLAITEILHDLRHYCDAKTLAFDKLDTVACEYYLEYVKESPWISRRALAPDV